MTITKKQLILIVLLSIPVIIGLVLLGLRHSGRRSSGPTPITESPPDALNILHFNDGYDVRKTPRFLTKWLERKDENTLTLFSGDIISPSLISNYMKGNQFVPFMKISDVQFAVPGNHEYDFGEEQFEAFIAQAQTKWLLANLKVKGEASKSASNLAEHFVKTIRNTKIGIFGLIDTAWQKSNKLDASKFDYEPFDEAAKRKSAELKALGCQFIFVLTHMSNASDEKLLSDDNGIDVVFGGHDHIFFIKRLNDKLLVKSGTDFENFSHVKLFLSDKPPEQPYFCDSACKKYDFLLDEEVNDNQVFFNFTMPRQNKFLNVVIEKIKMVFEDDKNDEMKEYIRSTVDPQIKDFLLPMVRFDTKVDTRESNIQNREIAVGNFFADLARATYGTNLGVVNAGIFKAEKLFDKNTFFRKIDLMKVFPYKRDVVIVVELTGQEIIQVIETSLSKYPKPNAQFLSWSGLVYEFDPKKEAGHRVVAESIMVDGVPLDLDKQYSVAMVSGLQHPQFGIDLLKAKTSVTPEAERLEPIALFETFAKLAEDSQNFDEFMLLKELFPEQTFTKTVSVIKSKGGGSNRLTSVSSEEVNDSSKLESLSAVALKRLKRMALADQILTIDGRNIFAIAPVVEGRIKMAKAVLV